MFLSIDMHKKTKQALLDAQGVSLTYGELVDFSEEFAAVIGGRTLVYVMCRNCVAAAAGYVSCMANKIVPLMLADTTDSAALKKYIETYPPAYIWLPEEQAAIWNYEVIFSRYGYTLLKTGLTPYEMNPELSQLLSTSGSTGNPKLVRHSYENVIANAKSISEAFELNADERAMASLPINFTQGLSTLNSNLYVGATVLFNTASLMQKEYWSFMKEQRASSFTGVPYSYEILWKLRFTRMDLPDLKIINQGGGRLRDELFHGLADHAKERGIKFIATYGSTETTSRMAFLNPELATQKCGSIGSAVPMGKLTLLNEDGTEILGANEIGEIIYSGPNVTWGYAECGEDLLKGDERGGVYETGDMAWRDEDGCFYIVGRKKRFLKLFGYRVSLDGVESSLKEQFGPDVACVGTDKKLIIYTVYEDKMAEMREFIVKKTGIFGSAFEARYIAEIPKNNTGKTQYTKLSVD